MIYMFLAAVVTCIINDQTFKDGEVNPS